MSWDVKDLTPRQRVFEVYPEVKDIFYGMDSQLNSFRDLSADMIVRYIILTYHFDSHLVKSKTDLMYRKKQAMLLAGVKADKHGYFSHEVMAIIANKNPNAIDLKMRFLRFENSLDWVELSALTEVYYDYIRTISDESENQKGNKTPTDIFKTKQAIIKESEGLKNKIDVLSTRVFKGDVDLSNFVGSTVIKEERKMRVSPEVRVAVKHKIKEDE